MKKLITIICIIAMMFAICACNDQPAPAPTPDQTPAADTSDSTAQASATDVTTDLEDGFYMTVLNDSPLSEGDYYANGIEFREDRIILEASFVKLNDDWEELGRVEHGTYTFAVTEDTEYRTGGSDGVRGYKTQAEFQEFMRDLMNSGLGFEIKVENGIAVEVGVYS